MSILVLCQFFIQAGFFFFFFWILTCMSDLYILDINPLSDILFANIFSHSVGCFFILLVVSLAVQKLFRLMSPICLILLLLPLLEKTYPKNVVKTDIKEVIAYIFFWEFYGFMSYI